jgi:hypothetical protein
MGANTVTTTSLEWNTAVAFPTPSANNTSDGTLLKPTRGDEQTIIYLENTDSSNAEKVVIEGGDGYGAHNDLTIELLASGKKIISVESARYMKRDGYIHAMAYEADGSTESDDVKFAVICTPR